MIDLRKITEENFFDAFKEDMKYTRLRKAAPQKKTVVLYWRTLDTIIDNFTQ